MNYELSDKIDVISLEINKIDTKMVSLESNGVLVFSTQKTAASCLDDIGY